MQSNVTHISPTAPFPQQTSPAASYRSQLWYMAYMDALFEAERERIAERIRYAEHSMVLRERELFASQDDVPERRALANALHALHALRSCLGL
jgi:hypothetical protein